MMEDIEYGFGQHLMMDGYGCDREKLMDIDGIYNFLSSYPEEINMTKIMPPYVFKYAGLVPEDWGISGFVIIAESHISVHTFPDKSYLSVDIFSCKQFDGQAAINYISKLFDIQKVEVKFVDRGLEFPKVIRKVHNFISSERMGMTA